MADLIVLGFDNREDAERVFEMGASLEQEELIDLSDAALAWQDEKGKVRIQQSLPTTAAGAGGGASRGALWGTLLGLLFLQPLAGFAIGAVAGGVGGAISGSLIDIGINDDLIRRIGEQLQPGKAAVFVLVNQATTDRVIDAVKPYNPTVIQTSLTRDSEEELVESLLR